MSKLSSVFAVIIWLLMLFAGFCIYGSTGHDDPHINFWFAHTLLEQGEMVNYNGDRFEQTTSLLLVFLTAIFSVLLPFDLVTSGYLVDVAASVACCVLLVWLARSLCPVGALWPSLLALGSMSFLLWTFGGMGSVLAALCLLLGVAVWWRFLEAVAVMPRHWWALGIVGLLLVLVRPEMPLVAVAMAVWALFFYWSDPLRRKRCLQLLVISLLAACVLFAWQKFYFSSWLPLPVLAKQSGSLMAKLDRGFFYVGLFTLANPVIAAAMLLSLPLALWLLWSFWRRSAASRHPEQALWVISAGAMLVYVGFVWVAGGDWMQAGRFMVPVVPVAALLVTTVLFRLLRRAWIVHGLMLALFVLGLTWHPKAVQSESHGVPVWASYRLKPDHARYGIFERLNQEHLRDMAVIDHLREIIPQLHRKLGRPVRLLSGQGGMVFYTLAQEFPGAVEFSDLRGLVEGSFTLCPDVAGVQRTAMGIAWNYREFFTALPALQTHCAIQAPDVIYDLNDLFNDLEALFAASGYVMVHQEQGFVMQDDMGWPTNKLFVPNVIFVQKPLLSMLDRPEKRLVDYVTMPLNTRWGHDAFVTSPVWRRQ